MPDRLLKLRDKGRDVNYYSPMEDEHARRLLPRNATAFIDGFSQTLGDFSRVVRRWAASGVNSEGADNTIGAAQDMQLNFPEATSGSLSSIRTPMQEEG